MGSEMCIRDSDYPTPKEEREMLDLLTKEEVSREYSRTVARVSDIELMRKAAADIYADDKIRQYIISLVWASRTPEEFGLDIGPLVDLGASPRAVLSLFLCARAEALLNGEDHVDPQMVKDIAIDVMQHRIALSYEAEAQGLTSSDIVKKILDSVEVP